MSSIPSHIMKKNNILDIKSKKKTIPININSNPTPGKFLFSNQINSIASSYLSMGQKIQNNKNINASKLIHVNTNSGTNYYTINSKETKQTNSSISNSIYNNIKNNNRSEINSININNYFNINNNLTSNHYEVNSIEKNNHNFNNVALNSRDKKQICNKSNSHISNNDLFINGYHSSKNNLINSKLKIKANGINTSNNLPKTRQTYSSRPNFMDSRNKTKKVPMKSRIRQYNKNQNVNNKFISSSFSNVYNTKCQFKVRDINNYYRRNLMSSNTNENMHKKNRNDSNYNFININKNLYEIKNRHFRHNTASFVNKEIKNIFHHKKSLSKNNNKLNKNISNIGNINNNLYINHDSHEANNRNINPNQIRKNEAKNNSIRDANIAVQNIINKIKNNSKKKINQSNKGKINNGKFYENKLNLKESNYCSNKLNSNKKDKLYYTKNNSNNNNTHISKNHSNIIHQNKVTYSNNNISIAGIKKIFVKKKEIKKSNKNLNNKLIPTPNQKIISNIIPSQRNIKINLAKFLLEVKNNQNNKINKDRKSLSIKRISKENNTDFSIKEINDKLTQKILKNNKISNQINSNCLYNNKEDSRGDKNTKIEDKAKENEKNDVNKDNNKLISDKYILNNNNKEIKNIDLNEPLNLL